jgi:hypothetical protein
MRVASQVWQIVFASQTLQVFCLALRKKAQYVVVGSSMFIITIASRQIKVGNSGSRPNNNKYGEKDEREAY